LDKNGYFNSTEDVPLLSCRLEFADILAHFYLAELMFQIAWPIFSLHGWIYKLLKACWLRNRESCLQYVLPISKRIYLSLGETVKIVLAAFGDVLIRLDNRKLQRNIFPVFRIRWFRNSNYGPGSILFIKNSQNFQKKR